MKLTPGRRALDKIYKRRDRYEIPDWQRGEVWDLSKKQQLIDSILRGWRLPKFYLAEVSEDEYEVVDGQQRLAAIYEFFANELYLSAESVEVFGGSFYKDLSPKNSDSFDDFEIDFDLIEDASEEDLKIFFQRLQQGLPLRSSERLNAIHSKLRDFCKAKAKHVFLAERIGVADTRFSHFDILSKVAAIEVEGIDTGLRFEDIRKIFESQAQFSSTSGVAKRIDAGLLILAAAFPKREPLLKNRTIVQSVITFACKLVEAGKAKGLEKELAAFVKQFIAELSKQVELGQAATDFDFIRFQKSVSANIKAGTRIRQEILLRKAFLYRPKLADALGASAVAASGVELRVYELGQAVADQVGHLNAVYSSKHGEDLFKATNKTTKALLNMRKPIKDVSGYKSFIDDLYFVFKEGAGKRLGDAIPLSFADVNTLRTGLQHDVDHGSSGKISAKQKKIGAAFEKYSAVTSPDVLDPSRFVLVQANLLSALELDLQSIVA